MKNRLHRRLFLAALVAAVAGTGAILWARADRAPAPQPFAFHFHFPRGQQYRYRFHWQAEQHASLGAGAGQGAPQAIDMQSDLEGDLVLSALGERGGAQVLSARIEDLLTHDVQLMGQPLVPDDAVARDLFAGREATVEIGDDGAIRAIRFVPSDPDLFKHCMQWLLTETQLALPADDALARTGRWTAVEALQAGEAGAEYVAERADPPTVERTRSSYRSLRLLGGKSAPHALTSRARFTLDPAGHLAAVAHRESLSLEVENGPSLQAIDVFDLVLRSVTAFEPPQSPEPGLAARPEIRRVGEIPDDPGARRQMIQQRAAGMVVDQVLADLAKAAGGSLPDHNAWFNRAVGALQLEPERARELAAVFAGADATDECRALVLDLLAGAGTPQAQAVLRGLLDSPPAHRELRKDVLLVQRLSLVEQPTDETLQYAARRFQVDQGPMRTADAYALGAVLGHYVRAGGDPAAAAAIGGALESGLKAAADPAEQAMYLRAVGNAGLASAEEAVVALADSPDERVREAAASALRRLPTAAATEALVALAASPEPHVQAVALDSLRGHPVADADLARLAGLVSAGALGGQNAGLLVSVLEQEHLTGGAGRQVLQALAGQPGLDPALRSHLAQLLAMGG